MKDWAIYGIPSQPAQYEKNMKKREYKENIMKTTIFREYDIRGIVGDELVIEQVYDLARAIVTFFKKKYPNATTIIVGRDGRTHSPVIFSHITNAITDMGLHVIDIGICPTPATYFAACFLNIPIALAITASHNPKQYNGIKMVGVWGAQIQEIKNIFQQKAFDSNISGISGTIRTHDIISDYIEYLANHFSHLKKYPIKAVIDCGNGAAGSVIPELIKKMEWPNIKLLCETVDGTFPNHEADPTVRKNMLDVIEALEQNQELEVALGFDGDADRMNPMTKSGHLVPGDQMLGIYAQYMLKDFPGATVVFDIKSSGGLIDFLTKHNGVPYMSPSGHSIIKERMAATKALLGGELSCHFFFHDRYFGYDDGIYAALRLFEILHATQKTLDQLLQDFPKKVSSPEFRIMCLSDSQKTVIVEHVKTIFAARKDLELITIDGVRAHMNYGWGLARASNTQPAISLRFESDTQEGLHHVKTDFFNALQPYFEEQRLRKDLEL